MDNNILKILQESPVMVPRILLNNYRKLNINEEELIVIMLIISLGGTIEYNPDVFVKELGIDKQEVMSIISRLIGKNILSIEIVKNGRKSEEYLSLSLLYNKLLNIVKDVSEEDNIKINSSIFNVFEEELGRLLSPMEIEKIKEWVNTYKNDDLIISALNEAVLNGVNNLRYIDAILNEWNKKGYKNKEDILKDKSNYRKKKSSNIIDTDLDWLNDD